MAVERHHDHDKYYKEKYLIEMVPYSFRGIVIIIMVESLVAGSIAVRRQTWCWRIPHLDPKATGS